MKELEARGIVERRVLPDSPARVEYAVTDMGRELAPTLKQLKSWSHRWLA
jgi:DNA-binding HxlR family transcriptional regulator